MRAHYVDKIDNKNRKYPVCMLVDMEKYGNAHHTYIKIYVTCEECEKRMEG